MRHPQFTLILALALLFHSQPGYADFFDRVHGYASLFVFNRGYGSAEHLFKFYYEESQYGAKCIENFSRYSPALLNARTELQALKGSASDFYSGKLSKENFPQFKAQVGRFTSAVSRFQQELKQQPVKFISSDGCSTSSDAHKKVAERMFWNPLPETLDNLVRLLKQDIAAAEKTD